MSTNENQPMSTNKRPTPETDAARDTAHQFQLEYQARAEYDDIPLPIVVPVDLARQLERERDEAREQLAAERAAHRYTRDRLDVALATQITR